MMATPWDELRVFKAHEKDGKNYWRWDRFCRNSVEKIGIERKTRFCLRRNISPDGRHILVCTDGLKIYRFTFKKTNNEEAVTELEPTGWIIPFSTKEYDTQELASRVKFESNSIIRVLTRDNRDILFALDKNEKKVHYLSEVKVENPYKTEEGHKLTFDNKRETFEQLTHRSSLMNASYWHRQNLITTNKFFEEDFEATLNRIDMIRPVKKTAKGFTVQMA